MESLRPAPRTPGGSCFGFLTTHRPAPHHRAGRGRAKRLRYGDELEARPRRPRCSTGRVGATFNPGFDQILLDHRCWPAVARDDRKSVRSGALPDLSLRRSVWRSGRPTWRGEGSPWWLATSGDPAPRARDSLGRREQSCRLTSSELAPVRCDIVPSDGGMVLAIAPQARAGSSSGGSGRRAMGHHRPQFRVLLLDAEGRRHRS